MSMDDYNYYNDPRVRAKESDGLTRDLSKMTLTWMRDVEDDECDDEECDDPECHVLKGSSEIEVIFPGKFEVCPTCNGKGKHVNPSIDAGGIGEDDEFWGDDENEDGESAYFSGRYDVTCYQCAGRTTWLVIDEAHADATLLAKYHKYQDDEAEYAAECRAERRMGC